MYISHSVMDRLGVKATNSKAKARGVKAKDLAPKAKDTPAGLEAKAVASRTPSLIYLTASVHLTHSWCMSEDMNMQSRDIIIIFMVLCPRVGSGVVRIDPLHFLARCCKRQLNQVYHIFLACFMLYCCLIGPFLCIVSFCWYVFCLLVVKIKLSLLANRLASARKTSPRKSIRGEGIVSIKPRPKRAYHCVGFCSFIVLLHYICVVSRRVIYITLLWHDIVLKVPLNTKQINKPKSCGP